MEQALKPVEVLAYPTVGKLAGIVLDWEEKLTLDSFKTRQFRVIKFSDVWMVSLQAGYLTIGSTTDDRRKVVLRDEPACVAWGLWQRWIQQNAWKPIP